MPYIQSHSHSPAEGSIYDLDDLLLIPRLLSQGPKVQAGATITCRFLAIPLNEPDLFSRDIAQYGDVVLETRDALIIRVPHDRLDLIDRVRQLWVSKYLTPYTECTMTFELPKRMPKPAITTTTSNTTTVIVQRALRNPDINGNILESTGSRSILDAPHDEDAASLQAATTEMTNTRVRTT
ncbi:hypothetical protein F5Y14DRAFT_24273 [Nemania sp. NC0429]|nr:hypothetical protein F5Y14DRAFT_24273 [Nemania sp. NC0429]